jgi:hypothetical protein
MSEQNSTEGMVALRTESGAWYELRVADLERARITDAAMLDEVRGQAMGGEAPAIVLSGEALAAHLVGGTRAAELEAAGEVTGYWSSNSCTTGDHRQVVVMWWQPTSVAEAGSGRIGAPNSWTAAPALVLATAPNVRFGGDKPYLR